MGMNITELAQSLKAAAEKATPGQWMRSSVQFNCITDIANPMEQGNKPHIANTSEKRDAEFIALANPANVIALVEALEKAQLVDEELCKLLPPGVEYMDPPDGGDVTPLEGVRRMVADYRQRIAEQESLAVKLPELCVGVVQGGHAVMAPYPAGHWFNKTAILEMLAAAGIKVEAIGTTSLEWNGWIEALSPQGYPVSNRHTGKAAERRNAKRRRRAKQ